MTSLTHDVRWPVQAGLEEACVTDVDGISS
jgi:hypothetical protein